MPNVLLVIRPIVSHVTWTFISRRRCVYMSVSTFVLVRPLEGSSRPSNKLQYRYSGSFDAISQAGQYVLFLLPLDPPIFAPASSDHDLQEYLFQCHAPQVALDWLHNDVAA